MEKCFVIQPFDKGAFDKRFDDHIAPAIKEAGLEPYRVDRDPGVRIPIESIHKGIGEAGACLADITTNNPNVWYELGYALASQKEVILICSKERADAFPFDVRHLNIIHYSTSSGRDFTQLEQNITEQLTTRLAESENIQTITATSDSNEVDKHVFSEIRRILKSNEIIHLLRETSLVDRILYSRLDPIYDYLEFIKSPESEFLNPTLEGLRVELNDAMKKLHSYHALETSPLEGNPEYSSVSDYTKMRDRGSYYSKITTDLDRLSDEVCSTYDKLIRQGRRILSTP